MNPLNFRLKGYDQIEELSAEQLVGVKENKKVVILFNLVVDYTGFDHPGYNNRIDQFQAKQITKPYINEHHSFNADLILCHRTIGKINNSQQHQGRQFYESIKNSTRNINHEASLQKINFNNPLATELLKLNPQQLTSITQVPKIFDHPELIKFNRTWFQNIFNTSNIYYVVSVFLIQILMIAFWAFINHPWQQVMARSPFLLLGAIHWTFIQYFYHRFLLHQTIESAKTMTGHLIHHAFPNLKQKISIFPIITSAKFLLLAFAYSFIMDLLTIGMLFIGIYTTIILYEGLHYYCHFGGETNIRWLKYMRIYHLKHHYRDQSRYFGVTNPFWDQVFGTGLDPKLKK